MRILLITLGVLFVMAVAYLEVFHVGGKYDSVAEHSAIERV